MGKSNAKLSKFSRELEKLKTDLAPELRSIRDNLRKGIYSESTASLATLVHAGYSLEFSDIKNALTDVIYEMLQFLAKVDWNNLIWIENENVLGERIPRVILSSSYYDDELKANNYYLWSKTYIDNIGSEIDFLERFILPYLPNLDKCKELVGKAKKGTLVYTDIVLADKLDNPNIKVIENGTAKTQNKDAMPQNDNINSLCYGDSKDYIISRLKRDAELGDSKAIEVEKKVREGKFTSARQVALEMGYRKPVKQRCLPKDVNKAVEKIVRELGEDYAKKLAKEILGISED